MNLIQYIPHPCLVWYQELFVLVSETKQKKVYHHLDAACIISHILWFPLGYIKAWYNFLSRNPQGFFGTTSKFKVTVTKSMENGCTPSINSYCMHVYSNRPPSGISADMQESGTGMLSIALSLAHTCKVTNSFLVYHYNSEYTDHLAYRQWLPLQLSWIPLPL